jgi:hypothetical protein
MVKKGQFRVKTNDKQVKSRGGVEIRAGIINMVGAGITGGNYKYGSGMNYGPKS